MTGRPAQARGRTYQLLARIQVVGLHMANYLGLNINLAKVQFGVVFTTA